ncbi:MAG: DUF2905 domain-containing protein [Rhodoplanes sp.]|jgi:hypothetical protein
MGRFLIIVGLTIVVIGLLWPWLTRLGLGRLPGDIYIQGERGSLYIPITTSILVSLALSLLLWLFSR